MSSIFRAMVPKGPISPSGRAGADGDRPEPATLASAGEAYRIAERLNEALAPNEAEPFLRRALELDPKHEGAALSLGNNLADAGRPGEALALLDDLLEKDASAAAIRFARAGHRLRQGKLREAAEDYRRCLADRPSWTDAYPKLLVALCRLGARDEAESTLVELRRRAPGSPELALGEKLVARSFGRR